MKFKLNITITFILYIISIKSFMPLFDNGLVKSIVYSLIILFCMYTFSTLIINVTCVTIISSLKAKDITILNKNALLNSYIVLFSFMVVCICCVFNTALLSMLCLLSTAVYSVSFDVITLNRDKVYIFNSNFKSTEVIKVENENNCYKLFLSDGGIKKYNHNLSMQAEEILNSIIIKE